MLADETATAHCTFPWRNISRLFLEEDMVVVWKMCGRGHAMPCLWTIPTISSDIPCFYKHVLLVWKAFPLRKMLSQYFLLLREEVWSYNLFHTFTWEHTSLSKTFLNPLDVPQCSTILGPDVLYVSRTCTVPSSCCVMPQADPYLLLEPPNCGPPHAGSHSRKENCCCMTPRWAICSAFFLSVSAVSD